MSLPLRALGAAAIVAASPLRVAQLPGASHRVVGRKRPVHRERPLRSHGALLTVHAAGGRPRAPPPAAGRPPPRAGRRCCSQPAKPAHRVDAGAVVEQLVGRGRRVGQHERIGRGVDVQRPVVLPKHRLRARQGQQAWGGSRKWEATLALRGGQAYRECARHGLWRGGAAAQGRRGGRVRCAGAAGSPDSPAALGTGATAAAPSRTRAGRAARWRR